MQITDEEKSLIECFLSEQMTVKQFYEHSQENPNLLKALKIFARRYEKCGDANCAKEILMIKKKKLNY